jgi:hypothetical protein
MELGLEVSKGFLGKVVQAGFGFVGAIIFARVLGPTGFGGFFLLLSLVEISKRPSAAWQRPRGRGTPKSTQTGANLSGPS